MCRFFSNGIRLHKFVSFDKWAPVYLLIVKETFRCEIFCVNFIDGNVLIKNDVYVSIQ